MSINGKVKLTSVKVIKNLYEQFKHTSLDESFNLQKLVNRAIFLYNTDDNFRDKVNEVDDLKISGSSF